MSALLCGADVVLVCAAVTLVLAVDKATGAPFIVTVGAVQQAAQEVEVDAIAVALSCGRCSCLSRSPGRKTPAQSRSSPTRALLRQRNRALHHLRHGGACPA